MPHFTFSASPAGLIVDVLVGLGQTDLDERIAASRAYPNPIWCRGEIDTGSSISGVSSSILRSLGLSRPVRRVSTTTAGGQMSVDLYRISMTIMNLADPMTDRLHLSDVEATELPHTLIGIDLLIGLDVLLQYQFHLNGPASQFKLDF